MDGKQPLALILIILAFGVAVAAAIWVFGSKNIEAYRTGMINDMTHIASNAYLYRMKPATLGGGGGTYVGYSIPEKMRWSGFGSYEILRPPSSDSLFLVATAAQQLGMIEGSVGPTGFLKVLGFTGDLNR